MKRIGCFETNSSSVHTLSGVFNEVDRRNLKTLLSAERIVDDTFYLLEPKGYGWSYDRLYKTHEKLDYFSQYCYAPKFPLVSYDKEDVEDWAKLLKSECTIYCKDKGMYYVDFNFLQKHCKVHSLNAFIFHDTFREITGLEPLFGIIPSKEPYIDHQSLNNFEEQMRDGTWVDVCFGQTYIIIDNDNRI